VNYWVLPRTVINTQLATCFGSSELYSGQFLIYRYGAFSDCAHYIKNWPEGGPLERKHVAIYISMTIYALRLSE